MERPPLTYYYILKAGKNAVPEILLSSHFDPVRTVAMAAEGSHKGTSPFSPDLIEVLASKRSISAVKEFFTPKKFPHAHIFEVEQLRRGRYTREDYTKAMALKNGRIRE